MARRRVSVVTIASLIVTILTIVHFGHLAKLQKSYFIFETNYDSIIHSTPESEEVSKRDEFKKFDRLEAVKDKKRKRGKKKKKSKKINKPIKRFPSESDNIEFSACLMVKDENHNLPVRKTMKGDPTK